MKILITTHHLRNYSGSKTWVFTIAKELSKTHDVTVAAPNDEGEMATKIRDILHVPVMNFDELNGMFDLGILAQTDSKPAIKFCKKTVFVCHGPTEQDRPLNECDVIVSCSPAGAEKWNIDIVLPQPIDTDWYDIPKKILYASSMGNLKEMIQDVCKDLGYKFRHATGLWNLREQIEWADIVVGASRVALEAMSCGKQVIIADHKPVLKKALMDNEYNLSHNCSGMKDKINVTREILKEKFLGDRKHILENHDVKKICKQLLSFKE